jgi:hypothetical protein
LAVIVRSKSKLAELETPSLALKENVSGPV